MWIYQGGRREGRARFMCCYCRNIVGDADAGRVCPHCHIIQYGDDAGDPAPEDETKEGPAA